jgi:alpha-1,3-mannosylglycoprotein beta-1,4-N-acetylglucosaminyltransferase A/B
MPWRRNGGIFVPTAIVCLLTLIFIFVLNSLSNSGESENEVNLCLNYFSFETAIIFLCFQDLEGKIAELHDRLDHLYALDKSKQKSFLGLQQQLQMMIDANISYAGVFGNRSAAFQRMFRANLSQSGGALSAPTIFDFLPHLLESPSLSLEPAARISHNRSNVHFVIGIPTVKRPKVSYLIQTLRSLIDNLATNEMNEVMITLFIAEIGLTPFATETIVLIQSEFNEHLESGLLEVVVPPSQFYPDFSKITPTFGDSEGRISFIIYMYGQCRKASHT